MYRNKTIEIKVLAGAREFINSAQTLGKQTVLLVGSNDISNTSSEQVYGRFKDVYDSFQRKFPSGNLNIFQVLQRFGSDRYNSEASNLNDILCQLDKNFRNVSIIASNDLNGQNRALFNNDSIHLSKQGTGLLVKALKVHLNPKIGLEPYIAYNQGQSNQQRPAIQTKPEFI